LKTSAKYYILLALALIAVFVFFTESGYNFYVNTYRKIIYQYNLLFNEKKTWKIAIKENGEHEITLESPVFYVNKKYKSMEGPSAYHYFKINELPEIIWITGYKTEVYNYDNDSLMSHDFICHNNLEFDNNSHYNRFGITDRSNKFNSRLIELSQGFTELNLPQGFGIPVFSNQVFSVATQVLNHNYEFLNLSLIHKISIRYVDNNKQNLIPLMKQSVNLMVPVNEANEFVINESNPLQSCGTASVSENHLLIGDSGKKFTGHWIAGTGKNEYRTIIGKIPGIKRPSTVHVATAHLHPYADTLELWDKNENKLVLSIVAKNYLNRTGFHNVSVFKHEEGILIYPEINYELVCKVNNTSSVNQDMMAVLFLYFRDDEIMNNLKSNLTNIAN
jgi:hypothetical protein